MSVKFKAKQPWSGTFFKDRMNWLGCHEKLFVLATIPWTHSFFPLLHFFLLVTSHLSKNWSRVYVQGVPNYFSLSGRPGTACDFAFAVLMDLPIQGRECSAAWFFARARPRCRPRAHRLPATSFRFYFLAGLINATHYWRNIGNFGFGNGIWEKWLIWQNRNESDRECTVQPEFLQ